MAIRTRHPALDNQTFRRASRISASSSITTSPSTSARSARSRKTRRCSRTSARRAWISTACTARARARTGSCYRQDAPKFLIGTADQSPDAHRRHYSALPNDLERTRHGVALIGDHRNDENLVVAQTHLAFLKFHNKVVDHSRRRQGTAPALFDDASKLVRWHYQWMVLHDFVERLTEPGIVDKLLDRRAQVLSLQDRAVHAGRIRRRRVPSRPQHGARGVQPQPRVPSESAPAGARPRSRCCSSSAACRANQRRAGRARRAAEQLGDRLAPLLQLQHAARHAELRVQPLAQARSAADARRCTRCPGSRRHAKPTSRSATCGVA